MNETKELIASEGMYFTQVADVPIFQRIVVSKITFGNKGSIDNWKEITKEEGEAILKEKALAEQEEMYQIATKE